MSLKQKTDKNLDLSNVIKDRSPKKANEFYEYKRHHLTGLRLPHPHEFKLEQSPAFKQDWRFNKATMLNNVIKNLTSHDEVEPEELSPETKGRFLSKKHILDLKPGEIDLLVRNYDFEELIKSVKDEYNKQEKYKDSTFNTLRKKLEEPIQLSSIKKSKRRSKKFHQRAQKINTTLNSPRRIKKNSNSPVKPANNSKLNEQRNRLKLVDRIEMDRPIILADKMDILWKNPKETLPEINIVRYQIEKKKSERMKHNTRLRK